MIRHFQRKFIVVSTTALVVVLFTIIGSISAIVFTHSQNEVNAILNMLVENDGKLQKNKVPQQPRGFFSSRLTREGMFQYRYFSAQVPANQDPIRVDNQHILTVQPPAIKKLARRVIQRSNKRGVITYRGTRYAYRIKQSQQATQVVFLDESLLMSEAHEILRVSILLGMIVLVLYTTVLIAFSKRAIKPIIEAEHRQREFITNAGHELKTPLTVISANTEMQKLTTGENEWTQSTREQVTRLTRLINNLISLARIQEQPTIQITSVNISEISQRVADSFKSVAMQNSQKFQVHIQPNLHAQAEDSRLEELINILLDNANKYCDPQGLIKLNLNKAKRSKNVILTISNSYAAGKDVDYNKFFNRFYRADTAHHIQAQSGFGIGLSMAQQIVTQFHGKIRASYQDGLISFVITFRA